MTIESKNKIFNLPKSGNHVAEIVIETSEFLIEKTILYEIFQRIHFTNRPLSLDELHELLTTQLFDLISETLYRFSKEWRDYSDGLVIEVFATVMDIRTGSSDMCEEILILRYKVLYGQHFQLFGQETALTERLLKEIKSQGNFENLLMPTEIRRT